MEVSQIFGLWNQEIDSWFTNHEPLIPTMIGKDSTTCIFLKKLL